MLVNKSELVFTFVISHLRDSHNQNCGRSRIRTRPCCLSALVSGVCYLADLTFWNPPRKGFSLKIKHCQYSGLTLNKIMQLCNWSLKYKFSMLRQKWTNLSPNLTLLFANYPIYINLYSTTALSFLSNRLWAPHLGFCWWSTGCNGICGRILGCPISWRSESFWDDYILCRQICLNN